MIIVIYIVLCKNCLIVPPCDCLWFPSWQYYSGSALSRLPQVTVCWIVLKLKSHACCCVNYYFVVHTIIHITILWICRQSREDVGIPWGIPAQESSTVPRPGHQDISRHGPQLRVTLFFIIVVFFSLFVFSVITII